MQGDDVQAVRASANGLCERRYLFVWNIIYRYKVRWIEAAAASPVWTAMLVFNVEGDWGHLMAQELQNPL